MFFDELEIDAAPNTRIARATWQGGMWVVTPLDRSSAQTIDETPLMTDHGPVPWLDAPWDLAQVDWEILP